MRLWLKGYYLSAKTKELYRKYPANEPHQILAFRGA